MVSDLATPKRLKEISDSYGPLFSQSRPFRYVVIDEFFEEGAIEYLHSLFPGSEEDVWKSPDNIHTVKKKVLKKGPYGIKEQSLDGEARQCLRYLNSGTFVKFLGELTGIKGLCPDPYLHEGGFHLSGNGSKLDIHADYSHHDVLGLERRLNVLIYLNKDWDTANFGGELKLYDAYLCEFASIAPTYNRVVIFETNLRTYHGFPSPINLSSEYKEKHQGRKSVAMYYYSIPTGRAKHKIIFPEDPNFTYVPSIE